MNRVINLYVEGKGDMGFISQFITSRFGIEFDIDFDNLKANSITDSPFKLNLRVYDSESGNGGIDGTKIQDLVEEINTVNQPTGIESLLLLDADTDKHKNPIGGCEERKKYLERLKQNENFEYFLIPNHCDDGNLEDLLNSIISEKGTPFYSCLGDYVNGLKGLPEGKIPQGVIEITDFSKTQIEWYTYMMLGKSNQSNKKTGVIRDYLKDELWDLNSSSLDPLFEFLKKNFEEK